MRDELRISESLTNTIAVSITALFYGIFIVVAGSRLSFPKQVI